MALTATHLADKSALARFPVPAVAACLRPLLDEGELATCAFVDLEVLYSSRSLRVYEEILEERRSLDAAPITSEVMATAVDLQHELARRGQHRVPIPDLIISAAALASGLVVLHYDADFERIAAAGGAPHEWVVPPGPHFVIDSRREKQRGRTHSVLTRFLQNDELAVLATTTMREVAPGRPRGDG